jgi:hypothetical protein
MGEVRGERGRGRRRGRARDEGCLQFEFEWRSERSAQHNARGSGVAGLAGEGGDDADGG